MTLYTAALLIVFSNSITVRQMGEIPLIKDKISLTKQGLSIPKNCTLHPTDRYLQFHIYCTEEVSDGEGK